MSCYPRSFTEIYGESTSNQSAVWKIGRCRLIAFDVINVINVVKLSTRHSGENHDLV